MLLLGWSTTTLMFLSVKAVYLTFVQVSMALSSCCLTSTTSPCSSCQSSPSPRSSTSSSQHIFHPSTSRCHLLMATATHHGPPTTITLSRETTRRRSRAMSRMFRSWSLTSRLKGSRRGSSTQVQ